MYLLSLSNRRFVRCIHKTIKTSILIINGVLSKLYNNTSSFQENMGKLLPWGRPSGRDRRRSLRPLPGGLPRGNNFPIFFEIMKYLFYFMLFVFVLLKWAYNSGASYLNDQNHKICIFVTRNVNGHAAREGNV